jgi:hypothetical protein
VKTDIHCKVLARLRPADLLTLVGEEGFQLVSSDVVELQEMKRTVDLVFKLMRGASLLSRFRRFH